MPIMETRYYGLWAGKQTAKGTKNAAPSKRLVQVSGDFNAPLDTGSENYSDLTKYGGQTDWVNSLMGNGTPAVEATPTELAYLLWLMHGAETVAAVAGPPAGSKHTFTPSTNRGHWATFVKRVGNLVQQRQSYNDCLVSQSVIEGSTANKAVRITPTILSLDPAEVIAADPAALMPTDKAFLYTDGTGTFTIDGTVFGGQSQFTLTINEDLSPVFGDDTVPYEIVQGNAVVTLGVSLLFDAIGLAQWNNLVYGSPTPAAGTKPRKSIGPNGSYSFWLKQRDNAGALNGREFKLTIPAVRWTVPDSPGPAPDGGEASIALSGTMRPSATPYTIDVVTAAADVAFTV